MGLPYPKPDTKTIFDSEQDFTDLLQWLDKYAGLPRLMEASAEHEWPGRVTGPVTLAKMAYPAFQELRRLILECRDRHGEAMEVIRRVIGHGYDPFEPVKRYFRDPGNDPKKQVGLMKLAKEKGANAALREACKRNKAVLCVLMEMKEERDTWLKTYGYEALSPSEQEGSLERTETLTRVVSFTPRALQGRQS